MSKSRAFTLVELLVVIAIVAVILGLLAPSFVAVRQAGRTARCLANIRSLQQAAALYATDHRGAFIDVGLPHGGATFEELAWVNTLQAYYSAQLALRSPLDDSPHWPVDQGGQGVPLPNTSDTFRRTSYGCNNYLSRTFSPAVAIDSSNVTDRWSRVPAPSVTVHFLMMAETGDYAGSDHVHVESWWVSQAAKNLPPIQAASQVNTNAAGGPEKSWDARANYGFVDGHAETLPFASVYLNKSMNCFDPTAAALWPTTTAASAE